MKKYIIGQKISSQEAMELSIEEAKKGLAWVSPNPPVGCVIVDKTHKILSYAHHKKFGQAHAEINALKKIKNKKQLEGASLYVTLEPCTHQGKTPACTDTLKKYSFKKIYYGQKDLNPKVCGQGIKKLQSQKISCKKYSFFQKEIEDLYRIFNYNMTHKKTFISLKVASTLDGMMALSDGSSQWISCEASRDYVAKLRAYHDGVLIGVGTFLEDNPRLNIRKTPFQKKQNYVVILDPQGASLNLMKQSQLIKHRSLSKIIVVTKNIKQKSKGIQILKAPWNPAQKEFDLNQLKSILYQDYGLSSLLVEGGSYTFSSFVSQDQAQLLYQFLSPSLLGSFQALSWLEQLKTFDMKSKKRLKLLDYKQIDQDLLVKLMFS